MRKLERDIRQKDRALIKAIIGFLASRYDISIHQATRESKRAELDKLITKIKEEGK